MLGEKRIVELVKAGEGENELLAPKSFTSFNPFCGIGVSQASTT